MFKYAALLALASALPALAQQSGWGQCGGTGWSGATSCVSGYTCTYSNPYYSQCIPGSGSGGGSSSSSSHTTTASSTPPSGTTTVSSRTSSTGPTSTSGPSINPFVGATPFLSPLYVSEVNAAIASMTDSTLKAKASAVAQIPNFIWLDTVEKIPTFGGYLANATALQKSTGKQQLVQFVVYDLPDRDCAAYASNGEFSIANNGQADYFNYIDQIVAQVKLYPSLRYVAVIEPDSLANLVTNLSVQKCANAQTTYLACVNYAITQLNTVGVYMYMDAGHAGWLGWASNLQPAATLFASVYKNANSPPYVKGLATNVANYNSLTTSSPDPITQGDSNYDESLYIHALSPLLNSAGFPATFIVEQARSGVQNIRSAWGDWCNVKGAGFGLHPTSNTGDSLIDSIVWVKPGGECDGTSNTTSPRYDTHCGLSDALQPAPEAGTWFEAYFEQLLTNANPAL